MNKNIEIPLTTRMKPGLAGHHDSFCGPIITPEHWRELNARVMEINNRLETLERGMVQVDDIHEAYAGPAERPCGFNPVIMPAPTPAMMQQMVGPGIVETRLFHPGASFAQTEKGTWTPPAIDLSLMPPAWPQVPLRGPGTTAVDHSGRISESGNKP
jgi:hypothetical protein